MKNKTLRVAVMTFALVMTGIFTLNAQQVPQAVKEAFSSKHSQVKNAKWEKEGDHFEAEWMENGLEHGAVYDAQGNELMTEVQMDMTTLPQGIVTYIQDNFDGFEWEEAEEVTTAKGTFYVVEMEGDDKEVELFFDQNGNLVKQEVEHEDDGDDED